MTSSIIRWLAATTAALALTATAVATAEAARPAAMSRSEYRALMLRSEALNRRFHLGTQQQRRSTAAATIPPSSFSWGAFTIGAAAVAGFALLALGVLLAGRAARLT